MTDTPEIIEATPVVRKKKEQTRDLAPQSLTPAQMLSLAVQQDAPVEKLDKLMDLQERWEKNEARKAFEVAMVSFSAKCPVILKTRSVDFTTSKGRTFYKHAGLPETVEQIQDLMAECQLSRRWQDEDPKKPGNIRIRCIVSHILGHSESFAAEAAPDNSGNKNEAQAVASIITYLRRTTLFAVLGLVAADEVDDDGAGGKGTEPPKPKSSSLTDPTEKQAQQDFVIVAREKAGDPKLSKDVMQKLVSQVKELCGSESAVDCLAFIRKHNVLLSRDGSVAVQTEPDDQTPAAAPSPHTAEPSPQEAPQPPFPPFVCEICGQGHQVKAVKCLGRDGAKCSGKVIPNSGTWQCGAGHNFRYEEIVPTPLSARGKCPVCDQSGRNRLDILPMQVKD